MKKIVLVLLLLPTFIFAQERFILENPKEVVVRKLKKEGKYLKKMKYKNHAVVKLSKKEAKELGAIKDIVMTKSAPPPGKGPNKDNGGDGGGTTPEPQRVPWGVSRVGADLNLNKGEGVKVCVIDSGIEKNHPDLNVTQGENFVVKRGKIKSSDWGDDNGHGTHVAGTIAALDNEEGVVGVAPSATLLAVKVLDKRGSGYLSDITDGVYSCVSMGANIINMSLGGNADPAQPSPLKTAIEYAVAQGVIVVVASGNEGEDISGKVPAGYSSVIAVAASDSSDNIAYFSNYGLSMKDYTGPGVAVESTWLNGGYNTISGTSMATPHVAGIFALIISSGGTPVTETLGETVSREGSGLLRADLSAE